VSVICTVYNEGAGVGDLVDDVLRQLRPHDEFVVTDAGSSDGSREVLADLARRHAALRVVDQPGGRSVGRNAAVRAARHDHIACIDGGCRPLAGWLEHLREPFAEGAEWVAGFYEPRGGTDRSTCYGLVMVYVLDEVDPSTFLPSARSVAFSRRAFEVAGGFPEHLDFAEDTAFDETMLGAGLRPVFRGDARVTWVPPASVVELTRTLFRWGRGDGQAGLRGATYKRLLLLVGGTGLGVVALAVVAPRWTGLALIPLVADSVWRSRRKIAVAPRPKGYVLVPFAQAIHTVALLAGFLWGRWRDR
jgi:cellulose synthase/poly-beta-1,6-N-acetylglucosamine synthase-like glycosyltransferase